MNTCSTFLIDYASKNKYAPSVKTTWKTVKEALNFLGITFSPKTKIVHIIGSSGKGTTTLLLASLLNMLNFKIAYLVKPHVFTLNERMCTNFMTRTKCFSCKFLLENQNTIEFLNETLAKMDYPKLSLIEMFFVLELYQLHKTKALSKLDYLLVEAGMGIANDYTNIFKGLPNYYNLITTIEINHKKLLGNTLISVANNKFANTNLTRQSIWLFPNHKLYKFIKTRYPQVIHINEEYPYKVDITGAFIKIASNKLITTNLSNKKQVQILNRLILAIIKFNALGLKTSFSKIFKKDKLATKMFIFLPGRYLPVSISDQKTKGKKYLVIDNSHSKLQIKGLLTHAYNLTKRYKIRINILLHFTDKVKKRYTLKIINKFNKKIKYRNLLEFTYVTDTSKLTKHIQSQKLNILTGSLLKLQNIPIKIINKYNWNQPSSWNQPNINIIIKINKDIARTLVKNKIRSYSKQYKTRISNLLNNFAKRFLALYKPIVLVTFVPTIYEPIPFTINNTFTSYKNAPIIFKPCQNKNKWYLCTENKTFNLKEIYKKYPKIMLLQPALAIDDFGNRLGYGKGVYDNWLKELEYILIDIRRKTFTIRKSFNYTKNLRNWNNVQELYPEIKTAHLIVLPYYFVKLPYIPHVI